MDNCKLLQEEKKELHRINISNLAKVQEMLTILQIPLEINSSDVKYEILKNGLQDLVHDHQKLQKENKDLCSINKRFVMPNVVEIKQETIKKEPITTEDVENANIGSNRNLSMNLGKHWKTFSQCPKPNRNKDVFNFLFAFVFPMHDKIPVQCTGQTQELQ